MRSRVRYLLQCAVMVFFSLACGPIDLAREILSNLPTPTPAVEVVGGIVLEVPETTNWYIDLDGEDVLPCSEEQPCRTLEFVLGHVTNYDAIFIGPGRYEEPDLPASRGSQHTIAARELTIEGAGQSQTFILGNGARSVFYFTGGASASLRDMTVEAGGGHSPGSCIENRARGLIEIEDVTVQNCVPTGISNTLYSHMQLTNVLVREAREDGRGTGAGTGISNSGNLAVMGGRVEANEWSGVVSRGSLEMTGTTIEGNGLAGLVVSGSATVVDVTVVDNANHPTLYSHHPGVGIELDAVAEFTNLHVNDNEACVRVQDTAMVTIRDSLIEGCVETGLTVDDSAEVTLQATTIQNTGSRFAETSLAGGVESAGTTTLNGVTIRGTANTGIINFGNLTMVDSQVIASRGTTSALFNYPGASAQIRSSLFANNLGTGSVIDNRGTMMLENSTVSSNPTNAIAAVDGSLTMRFVTVSNNGNGGLAAPDAPTVLGPINNSMIVGNTNGDCYLGAYPPASVTGGANSIDSDGTCQVGATYDMTALMLDGLADNGGPTQTHALLIDSPAIDAASGSCPGVDQRGAGRPFGTGCDVGAYEFNPTFMATAASLEVTGTPPVVSDSPTVNTDSLCTRGPGPAYLAVQAIEQGVQVELVGRGIEGGWWIIDSPRYPGQNCWIPEDNVDVPPSLDVGGLPSFEIPPLPTNTPPPDPPLPPGQLGLGNVVCSAQDYIVALTWVDAANNEDGYRVYRNGSLIATLGPNATQYTDGNAPATGSPVTYGVESFNAAGASSRPEVVEPGCLF